MAEEEYVGALDQGTTGTRFIVFNKQGQVLSKAYKKHQQIYPDPGWVEHDPLEIWENTREVMRKATKEINPQKINSIGITNQRETTIIWDPETGNPLYNAIVWQDTRTRGICRKIEQRGLEDLIREKTGLRSHTYFSCPKIRWILENVPKVEKKIKDDRAIFGNIDSWLIWNLTGGAEDGVHITDYTNASRTMLMNLENLDWDDEILEELEVPRSILPEVRPSSDGSYYGRSKNAPSGIDAPICGDLGDQQAALFGQTCFKEGEVKSTYGTGCFVLVNTGEEVVNSDSGLISTPAYGLGDENCVYAMEGSIPIAGAAVQWLIDNLEMIDTAAETEEMAQSVEGTEGVYFVPAFSGLFAPHWDMKARGTIVGLTGSVKREHIVRSALEAICFQARDVLEAMRSDLGFSLKHLKVDGGMCANDFLLQLQADIAGEKIIRPNIRETTSLGAAYAAGLATGFWNDLEHIKKNWEIDSEFKPTWSAEKRDEQYRKWQRAVERARDWIE